MKTKFSKEDLKTEAWFKGHLNYKLHKGQRMIKKDLNSIPGQLFVGNCSRQWGKSYLMSVMAIELAIKKPGSRIKYGTAFLTDLSEFIIPIFNQIIEDCPKPIRPKYKVQGSKWVFNNGSEIKLVGLDKNPNGLRGNVIDMIILDEAAFMHGLSFLYKSVIIPATTHRPNCKVVMISTPPVTPAHDFCDFVHRAQAENCYAEYSIYSNPRIDADTIARLMKESGGEHSTTWRREYRCELITDADSKLIPEWDDKYVKPVERDEFFNFYHLYEGMDLGIKHFTVVLFGYYDFRRATLVIEDEIRLNGSELTTLVLKDAIEAKEKSLWQEKPLYRRVSDNNNLHLIQDLALLHRMSFIPTNKDTLEAMLNELRLMVAKGQIEVDPKCTQTIGCLKYGVWDSKKKGFALSSAYGHFDALAALIYLVRNLDKHCNPIPNTYGLDVRNSVIKTPRQNNPNIQLFNKILHKPTRRAS